MSRCGTNQGTCRRANRERPTWRAVRLAASLVGCWCVWFTPAASIAARGGTPPASIAARGGTPLTTIRVASGLIRPVHITFAPGDSSRLFIVEQAGKIKVLEHGVLLGTPFLDIDSVLVCCGERGLLGLAFHPDYAMNGFFFLNYFDNAGNTVIARYAVSNDPNVANPKSAQIVLTIEQPTTIHNGGWLGFGPDGYLYIATGDGGPWFDPSNRAQTITGEWLGKILRVDVDRDDWSNDPDRNYGVPPDNPFVGRTGDDEIWALGLRNPWRCAFDSETGDLYIADVGQGAREEINFQPASSTGGENYAWRVMEGLRCNIPGALPCFDSSFTDPIHEYSHTGAPNGGFSITGGYNFRGPNKDLQGTYFFADYVSNQIWTFRYDGANKTEFANRTAELIPDVGAIINISSFAEDNTGNLYIISLDGNIFKLIAPLTPGDFNGDGLVDDKDLILLGQKWLVPPLTEMAAHWKLDESSGTTATDSSANSYHGTLLNGPIWQPTGGKKGGALQFDGIDDFVEINDPNYKGVTGSASRTVACWIKTSYTGSNQHILSWGIPESSKMWLLFIDGNNSALRVSVFDGTIIGSTPIADGAWHHVAAVLDDDGTADVSEVRLYVDGQLEISSNVTAHPIDTSSDANVRIGTLLDGSPHFNGLIDDVRILDRAMTQEHIQALAFLNIQDLNFDDEINYLDFVLFAELMSE
ncbi:MAG: PQQ-dependent sugar dehydrogenase [Planctomycetes bacterium]|nr:PQQ-dependent sugar dehydrogenase [Planctomycetota bacterium]